MHYVKLEQPNQNLMPKLNISAPKSTTRGHYHPVLSRFLCPVEYLKDFDADPEEYVYILFLFSQILTLNL
jgi:hypothetical protein